MDRSLWAVALAGFLLLAPTVHAADGQGSFVVDGALTVPPGADVSGFLLGLYAQGTPELQRVVLTAPTAHLYVVEQQRVVVAPHPEAFYVHNLDPKGREWNLTGFRMELVAPSQEFNWVGVYPERSNLHFTTGSPLDLHPSDVSGLGDPNDTTGALGAIAGDVPTHLRRSYYVPTPGDHLRSESPGVAIVDGEGALKLFGGTVRITSAEWNADVETGNFPDGGQPAHGETSRWVYVEFADGAIEIENGGSTLFALSEANIAWNGPATFRPVRGEITSDETSYAVPERAMREKASLDGDLVASLVPHREAGRLVSSMLVEGTLASTNLQPQTASLVPSVGGGSSIPWLALFLFGTVVVGGSWGVAALVSRRRRAAPVAPTASETPVLLLDDGLQADDCVRFADEAAVERRWTRALHWAQRARVLAPNNARVRADEGEYLFQLGLFEEALQAFAAASRLDPTEGYADYRGAQAAAAAGRPVDEVMPWLQRALERSPDLVGDLELFKEFDNLRGQPAYDAMVRSAYERLGIDPAPGF